MYKIITTLLWLAIFVLLLSHIPGASDKAPLYPGGLALPHVQDKINECLGKGQAWEARISGSSKGPTMLINPRCVAAKQER